MPTDPNRVKSLFLAVVELPPAARAEYLDGACDGDAELRGRVEALLRSHEQEDSFLAAPGNDAALFPDPDGGTVSLPIPPPVVAEGSAPAPPPDAALGSVIGGRYTLDAVIGGGGMGTVYRATQTEPVKRAVAVKLIKAGMDSKAVVARFDAERQALALMDHPNIARVFDGGSTPTGQPFFVMELVTGVPLTEYCDRKRLCVRSRLELFVAVCQAVQHAHQKGIIHRDLKPSNVLVTEVDGRPTPKVIDFGVAKATEQRLTDLSFADAGAIVGTPAYMSPEQADPSSMDIDTRTDVYALGVVLYELLVGSPPIDARQFKRGAVLEMLRMVREVEPPKPSTRLSTADDLPNIAANRSVEPSRLTKSMRGELDWVVMKAIEKDRTRRYETANGLARDLQRHLADEVVEARPPSTVYRLKKFVRRHKGQALAASLVLFALVAGITGTTWGLIREARANADLGRKNAELAAEQEKVQARFELAQKAIATFHTGVSEDVLLKNDQFKELRIKLLKAAAEFYAELEKLLVGQTDARSRKLLASGYYQLGQLTDKIGSQPEALAVHHKALALRRELAAEPGANVQTRLDVARSLVAVGHLVRRQGNQIEALRAYEEQRDIVAALEAESPTDAIRAFLADTYRNIGTLLAEMRRVDEAVEATGQALVIQQKLADSYPGNSQILFDLAQSYARIGYVLPWQRAGVLEAYAKALAIQQKLADAHPGNIQFQSELASNQVNVGHVLMQTGKLAEARGMFGKALVLRQKLTAANPADVLLQMCVADSHSTVGLVLVRMGEPTEALEAFGKALVLRQKLAEANPQFQGDVLWCLDQVGNLLAQMGKLTEALEVRREALAIRLKRADANPTSALFQYELARTHTDIGRLHAREKRFTEALTALDAGLAFFQKLIDRNPKDAPNYTNDLGYAHAFRGAARITAGQPAEAAADLRRATGLWTQVPTPDPETRFELARALTLLTGLGKNPKAGVTAAEAATFGDRAIVTLREAINDGWSQLNELKEPDFDPLRDRADFRKLLAELESKPKPRAIAPPPRAKP